MVAAGASLGSSTEYDADHSHRVQTDPTIWMAASGKLRVIQHPGRQRTLERLVDGNWQLYDEGTALTNCSRSPLTLTAVMASRPPTQTDNAGSTQ